jgi:hypothetical protein
MQEETRRNASSMGRNDTESGEPGGGAGRRDEVGGSGVHPASAGEAPADSEIRTQAGWGQGERGAAGYQDSGSSELSIPRSESGSTETRESEREDRAGS